ncbi:MAG: hypothetical protein KDC38_10360 [Planctomycetes bacterium]|nr:hypothetical protein [Planctomycetota bacterium]
MRTLGLSVLLIFLGVSGLDAQPINDDCTNAIALAATPAPQDFDTTGATTDGPDLAGWCDPGPGLDDQIYNDVWYRWTPLADGDGRLEALSINAGARVAVFESAGCPAPADAVVDCTDLPSLLTGGSGVLQFAVSAGTTYLIRVGAEAPGILAQGLFDLQLILPEVENLNCLESATDISVSWTLPTSPIDELQIVANGTLAATLSPTETSYTYALPPVVPPYFEICVLTVSGGGVSPGPCCAIGTPAVLGDDCAAPIDLTGLPTPSFFVDGVNATTDGPSLAPDCDPGPGADDQIYNDVWFTYEVPATGSYLINVLPLLVAPRFAVYSTSSCPVDPSTVSSCGEGNQLSFSASAGDIVTLRFGTLAPGSFIQAQVDIVADVPAVTGVSCDDDLVPGQVEVNWLIPGGASYDAIEVRVGGALEATLSGTETSYSVTYAPGFTGFLNICVRGVVGAQSSIDECCSVSIGGPDNDDCVDALSVGLGTFGFDTSLASLDDITLLPTCTGPIGPLLVFQDVWYRFTATVDGDVTFSTCGSSFNTAIAVYQDDGICPPDVFAPLACDEDSCVLQAEVTIPVTSGDTYLVQVGGGFDLSGSVSGLGTLVVDGASATAEIFQRGDSNADGMNDISDVVFLLGSLFIAGSDAPSCLDAADSNDDGILDVSDSVYLLAFLFSGGAALPAPQSCGPDPSSDALDCSDFDPCP